MSATVAAGLLATLASNAMADAKAQAANENERENMYLQDMLNRRNNVLAYSDQVQGAKMAGLNPAMLNGATPNVAAPATKPNAHVAENVEFDPATLLLRAQKDNLDAQTEKTRAETAKIEGVDTENARADIDLKIAQRLFTGANQSKIEEETQHIRNVNQAFDSENDMLATTGQVMAEKWKSEPWYAHLGPDTKATIDSIADGSLPLSVGGMTALERVISAQKNLSDADRTMVRNAFDNVITEAMYKDQKVMEALAKLPDTEKRKAEAQIKDLVASARHKNIQAQWQEKEFKSKQFNDPDWTWEQFWDNPSLKNFGIWLQASYSDKLNSLRETAQDAAAHAAGGAALGRSARAGESVGLKTTSERVKPPIYHADGSVLSPKETTQGVHSFWH